MLTKVLIQRVLFLAVCMINSPAYAEEWTGNAGNSEGSLPIRIVIDANGGGTLSIGHDHYLLKVEKRENKAEAPSTKDEPKSLSGTPEAAEYMALVSSVIKKHWSRGIRMPEKHIIVRFYIKADGSIDQLRLDPTSDQKLDQYTVNAFDAVKQSVPFPAPPSRLLEDGKVEIKFAFDANHRSQTFGIGRGFFYSR